MKKKLNRQTFLLHNLEKQIIDDNQNFFLILKRKINEFSYNI